MATDERDMKGRLCASWRRFRALSLLLQRFFVGIDADQNAMEVVPKCLLPRSPSLVACKS